jgi:hypothetical protein
MSDKVQLRCVNVHFRQLVLPIPTNRRPELWEISERDQMLRVWTPCRLFTTFGSSLAVNDPDILL